MSRALELAASALGDTEPITRFPRDDRAVPSRRRLDAVAVLETALVQIEVAEDP